MIIAIDGTASSGKSSASRELAKRLGFELISTGSLYRAVTYKILFLNISKDDDSSILQMLKNLRIESINYAENQMLYIDKVPISKAELSTPKVSARSAEIAVKGFVREFVRKIQREIASSCDNVIVEGRDIGSVVFPNADYKFFIDADLTTRALRRQKDYELLGKKIGLQSIKEELQKRDEQDRHRELSPLIMTSDAILIDTSKLSISQVVDEMLKKMEWKK